MRILVIVFMLMLSIQSIANAEILEKYKCTYYEVQVGDTLNDIAMKFITPEREIREFTEGIVELNYVEIFAERVNSGEGKVVHVGDILKINHRKIEY